MLNRNNPVKTIAGQGGLFSLQETLLQQWEEALGCSQADKSRAGTIAERFLQLVGSHFWEQHSPLFYAARLHITKSYLRKCCQKAIGTSPMDCIQVRLMLEACALLANPGLSIQEVAWRLGFDDSVYFARFFKRRGGLPPGAYRKIVSKMA